MAVFLMEKPSTFFLWIFQPCLMAGGYYTYWCVLYVGNGWIAAEMGL